MTDTVLKAITIRPGINKDVTEYMAEGSWVDCDKIRFRNGRPEKIGGWVKEIVTQVDPFFSSFSSAFSSEFYNAGENTIERFTGVARGIISWNDLSFNKYLAVASHKKVELLYQNQIYDITPVRESVSLTDAISTVGGSGLVTIQDSNHNLLVGDYIVVTSQQTAVDGITLDGQYIVSSIEDANNFVINFHTDATGTSNNAGGTLEIDYLLENGYQSNGNLTGWSGGSWGEDEWGTPRTGTGGTNLRQWSLDTWGEDLIACVRNGVIYHWDTTGGVTERLAILSNAPTQNLFVLVSQPSRHLIAFGSQVFDGGAFDPLIIRWAEQETLDAWEITAINTAGEYRLPAGNYIVGAVQTKTEILIFTDSHLYSMRFVGGNDIFQFETIDTNISTISQHSFININGIVVWMGLDNFYAYDGSVRQIDSTLEKFIFDQDGEGRLNFSQKEKVFLGVNKEFNEIIWFYPKLDSEENDTYIKYNYRDNVFDFGSMNRSVWEDRGVFDKPYALTETGLLYAHEVGKDDDGAPLEAFIRSSYFDIDDGEDLMFVDKIVPDIKLPSNRNIAITVFAKKYPHPSTSIITKGPFYFNDTNNKISCRVRGRQMAVEYRVEATGSDFEIGKVRFAIQPDGER